MARIFPFRAYRYSALAGDPAALVTQPYDKITPEMQERYFSLSPYNLAHIIRGRSSPGDTATDNVYTRAARCLNDWIASGILVQDPQPSLFAYFQKFEVDGVARLRKGLIALGAVEDYSEGTVYRHELTHSGPKRDRLDLLRHTRAHFGQIFMLYDDPEFQIDAQLDRAAQSAPVTCVVDEYGAQHSLWRIADADVIAAIERAMAPRKLLIADGHHRYETALAFRNENPDLAGARKVMMTLVNMRSPGLVILPTHRVIGGLPDFDAARVLRGAAAAFTIEELEALDFLERRLRGASADQIVIGAAFRNPPRFFALVAPRAGRLDVSVLHDILLARVLGLTPEAVREEKNIRYVRGFSAAAGQLRDPGVQAVFFLNPVRVEEVARVAFSGGVMPQKSTDFFPKLLSGLTIYRIED
jgi:uncharacterized protein (DUF1015 family)